MAREEWQFGVLPPTGSDGNYLQVVGGVGPLEIAVDGRTITNLVTGDTYDLTAIGSGGGPSTDIHTAVSDDGTEVVASVSDIDFGSLLSVTDDGDSTVTVDGTDSKVRTRQANIPLTEIADGNTAVGLQKQIPSGKTLRILEMGVTDGAESATSGLTIEVQDLTNAVTIHSANTKHTEGDPLASKSGAIDVQFRVANATGSTANGSGYVLYTMEDTDG